MNQDSLPSKESMKQTLVNSLTNVLREKHSLSIHQLMQHLSLPKIMRNSFSLSYENFEYFLKSSPNVFQIDHFNNVSLVSKWKPVGTSVNYASQQDSSSGRGYYLTSQNSATSEQTRDGIGLGYDTYRNVNERAGSVSYSVPNPYGINSNDTYANETWSATRRNGEEVKFGPARGVGESSSSQEKIEESWQPEKVSRYIAGLLMSAGKDVYERKMESQNVWPSAKENDVTGSGNPTWQDSTYPNEHATVSMKTDVPVLNQDLQWFVKQGIPNQILPGAENTGLGVQWNSAPTQDIFNPMIMPLVSGAGLQWMNSVPDPTGGNVAFFGAQIRPNSPWETTKKEASIKETQQYGGRKRGKTRYDDSREKSRSGSFSSADRNRRRSVQSRESQDRRKSRTDTDWRSDKRNSRKEDTLLRTRSRSRSPVNRRDTGKRRNEKSRSSQRSSRDSTRNRSVDRNPTKHDILPPHPNFQTAQHWVTNPQQMPPAMGNMEPIQQQWPTVMPNQLPQGYDTGLNTAEVHCGFEEKRMVSTDASYSVGNSSTGQIENVIGQVPIQQDQQQNVFPYNWPNTQAVPYVPMLPQQQQQFGGSHGMAYPFPVQESASIMPPMSNTFQYPVVGQPGAQQQQFSYVGSENQQFPPGNPMMQQDLDNFNPVGRPPKMGPFEDNIRPRRRSLSYESSFDSLDFESLIGSDRSPSLPRYERERRRSRSPVRRRREMIRRSRSHSSSRGRYYSRQQRRSPSPSFRHSRRTRSSSRTRSVRIARRSADKTVSKQSQSTSDEQFDQMATRCYYRLAERDLSVVNVTDIEKCLKLTTGRLYTYMKRKYEKNIRKFFESHPKYFRIREDGIVCTVKSSSTTSSSKDEIKNKPEGSLKDLPRTKTQISSKDGVKGSRTESSSKVEAKRNEPPAKKLKTDKPSSTTLAKKHPPCTGKCKSGLKKEETVGKETTADNKTKLEKGSSAGRSKNANDDKKTENSGGKINDEKSEMNATKTSKSDERGESTDAVSEVIRIKPSAKPHPKQTKSSPPLLEEEAKEKDKLSQDDSDESAQQNDSSADPHLNPSSKEKPGSKATTGSSSKVSANRKATKPVNPKVKSSKRGGGGFPVLKLEDYLEDISEGEDYMEDKKLEDNMEDISEGEDYMEDKKLEDSMEDISDDENCFDESANEDIAGLEGSPELTDAPLEESCDQLEIPTDADESESAVENADQEEPTTDETKSLEELTVENLLSTEPSTVEEPSIETFKKTPVRRKAARGRGVRKRGGGAVAARRGRKAKTPEGNQIPVRVQQHRMGKSAYATRRK